MCCLLSTAVRHYLASLHRSAARRFIAYHAFGALNDPLAIAEFSSNYGRPTSALIAPSLLYESSRGNNIEAIINRLDLGELVFKKSVILVERHVYRWSTFGRFQLEDFKGF